MSDALCKGCSGDRDYHSDACNYYPKAAARIDQLRREIAKLRAEIERMRPVVEVAVAITPPNGDGSEDDYDALKRAVRTYESKDKP